MKPISIKFRILSYFIGISVLLLVIGAVIADRLLNDADNLGDFLNTFTFIVYGLRGILVILALACLVGIYYGHRKSDDVKSGFIYCALYTFILVISYFLLDHFG